MIKTITLYQPWASLVACGAKKYETRSWETKYRGPIAIHAAADIPREAKDFCPEVAKILNVEPYNGSMWYYMQHHCGDQAFGHILAVANLVECLKINEDGLFELSSDGIWTRKCSLPNGNERLFGDYSPGRYAWQLEDVYQLPTPIPAKGRQRMWNFDDKPYQISIDPWVIGPTKIWTPQGIRSGKRVPTGSKDSINGLEVVM